MTKNINAETHPRCATGINKPHTSNKGQRTGETNERNIKSGVKIQNRNELTVDTERVC